eukprot:219140-Pelagomonas_calceolata.AAC.7
MTSKQKSLVTFGDYLWMQEVEKVLGPERAPLFCDAYSIRKQVNMTKNSAAGLLVQGNCTLSPRSDPHDEFRGKNVPILLQPLERVAAQGGNVRNECGVAYLA